MTILPFIGLLLSVVLPHTWSSTPPPPAGHEFVAVRSKYKTKPRFYEWPYLTPSESSIFLQTVTDVLQTPNDTNADEKRLSPSFRVWNLSIPTLMRRVTELIPEICGKMKGMNVDSFRRLFLPPHGGRVAADRYWGVIEAHLHKGTNSYREPHPAVRSPIFSSYYSLPFSQLTAPE